MCRDHHHGSLDVETFSGFSLQNVFCKLDNIHDIRHVVRFYNLRNYTVDIQCNVSLKANPRKVQFKSTVSNDPNTTDVHWQGTIASLGIKGRQDFSHVQLINLQTGFGNEAVDVEIQADWPEPGKSEIIQLSLTVTV